MYGNFLHPTVTKGRKEEAKRVEFEAVRRGDYNFPGIGLPNDL